MRMIFYYVIPTRRFRLLRLNSYFFHTFLAASKVVFLAFALIDDGDVVVYI